MAVYTEINDEELAEFVEGYDIGGVRSCKGIAEGVENSNYLLVTQSGPFILTLYEKRVDPSDLPFFLGLMNHLAERGVLCPTAVVDKRGETLGEIAGRPAAIITFLDGVWPRRPRLEHCTATGKALAQLHLAAIDLDLRRDNRLSVAGWADLADSIGRDADRVSAGLSDEIAGELAFLETNWPVDLPTGIIHADLFPDNVFFLGEELSGVIDFYFACNDMLAYDLAICINAWCFEPDGALNVTKSKGLIEGYGSARSLTPREVKSLPILSRGAALRFLLTRINDWLSVPPGALVTPKDPAEYLGKLRFHRQAQDGEAYGIRI